MSRARIYVVYCGTDTYPETLVAISPKVWEYARHNQLYRAVTATAAHRWVRLGKPNLTNLRIVHGRIRLVDSLTIYYEGHPEMRDYHRRLLAAAEKLGATEARIVPGGAHPKLLCRGADGVERCLPIAYSPSDRRRIRNDTARLRRLLAAEPLR
jgi:hypothetical protein